MHKLQEKAKLPFQNLISGLNRWLFVRARTLSAILNRLVRINEFWLSAAFVAQRMD